MIAKLQKKKQEKGIGYVLEAFVAAIMLFIFAFSHHAEAPETRNWNNFQDQIGANDLTYVMQNTGHTDRMLSRGQIGSVQATFSGITGDRLSISGTIEDTPIGESRIGFYTPESDTHTENLVKVDNPDEDRCHGELEEIESEHDILRTQDESGSLERHHGVRLYIADRDPTHSDGSDEEENYDTFWVDNGTTCSFTNSEGPHLVEDYFLWGNKTDNNPNTVYDLKSVDPDSEEMTVYNASVPANIRKELGRPANSLNVETSFDSFNFPEDNLNYDLIIFQSRDNLDTLNSNAEQLLEYQKENAILLLMDLQKDDLDTAFLNETGLNWIDLDREPQENVAGFTNSTVSERTHEYFRGLRCVECELELPPGGKISSGTEGYVTGDNKMLIAANSRYLTEEWNNEEISMQEETGSIPEGLPQNNCGTYTMEEFEFPSEENMEETEEITVYNVPLGSENDCSSDLRGVGLDLDGDGEFTDDNEAVYLSDEHVEVNGLIYRVRIHSEDQVEFVFDGDNRVELINHREEFPDFDIGRFVRMGDIAEDGMESEESKIASAAVLWLLEEDRTFGDPTATEVETKAIGGIKADSYLPYKMYLRWSN